MSLFTPLIWLLVMSPVFIIAFFKSKKGNMKFLLLFLILFLADNYIQILIKQYLPDFGLKFSWLGKFLSLATSLLVIFFVNQNDRKEIGFTTSANSKKQIKFGVLVFLGFLIFDFAFKFILFPKGGEFDLETFAFQATMPGLTEEILFRGIYLWIFDRVFLPNWHYKGIRFGWSFVIVTLLFGVAHGIILTADHQLKFDIITIVYLTSISSLSLGILRKFTGNLIYSILGHNVINVMNAIIRIL
ncbi:CPBP family intramembrane metalloprotease [Epilithonimonas sp. JDS]|uniref:CPBP family intramembrane glutamic endopeptidase n=1 Tax=Epilithonimonas sp. JDS TaxID=2902797 RepID=UPI001E3BA819|nr:CPBP family intramembrane glutamic endopeptidase [Epilithonimonas sp. JDS]MCD9855280.1 CPBP family intramembrane metalloprotease [Epilithonimonas sp. JDS]